MIRNILKKDLKRKKTMNIIVLMFIIISTVFLASSVNNLITTNSALSYFAEQTKVADFFMITANTDEIEDWAEEKDYIDTLIKEELIIVEEGDLKIGAEKYDMRWSTSLSKLPQDYNLITDENDQLIREIKPGEIAVSYVEAQLNEVAVGDEITIKVNDKEKVCRVAYISKDMVFGSAYMGFTRLIISDDDYSDLLTEDANIWNLCSFISSDVTQLSKEINQENFMIMSMFDQGMLDSTYMLDMMVFSILIIVGICLIAIAFVVLRFTIVFTLQEDYKEIGIMKAIGLKDSDIKRLYLIKYLFLAALGTATGFAFSFPFGEVFMKTVRRQLVIQSVTGNMMVSALCALTVVVIVAGFCYFSTGKVNKYTAIQAIRNGSTGERFRPKTVMKLNRRKRLPAVLYLAFNDIISNFRNYAILVIVFTLGTLLVILPGNASNTLQSDSVIGLFGMRKTDIYIDNNRFSTYVGEEEKMEEDLAELEELYKENGVNISMFAEKYYVGYVYLEDEADKSAVNCIQSYQSDADEYLYLEGTPPVLENEVAMATVTMERIGTEVGDYVHIRLGEETRQYIITASYQTMMNMGEQIRLAEDIPVKGELLSSLNSIQGQFEDRGDITGQIAKIKEITPTYKIHDVGDYTDIMLDTIRDTLVTMKSLILGIVIVINALISLLMSKSLFTKDIGTIALLKSIGFRNLAIRIWQGGRIITVMLISLLFGILLSEPLNSVVAELTFGLMGASIVEMEIKIMEVYVLYPLLLLAATAAAVLISTLNVKKVGLKELGNLE